MNREDFLDKLFVMFAKSFTSDDKQAWWDAYKQVLSENIDYNKLYNTMLVEYEHKTAPMPAWLKAKASYNIREPESVTFKNIWATSPRGYRYQFGYNPQKETFALVAESLIKQGFTNVSEEEYAANGV